MKIILRLLAIMTIAITAYSQGTISISSGPNSVEYLEYGSSTPETVPANGGSVSFLWAPAGSPAAPRGLEQNLIQWLVANPAWWIVSTEGTRGGTPLVKSIGLPGRFLSTGIMVPTTAPVDLIVVGWTGNAPSFDAAYSMRFDVSVGFSDVIRGVNPAVAPAPPTIVSLSSLTLVSVLIPEPSTFALGVLGFAALLVSRRKK